MTIKQKIFDIRRSFIMKNQNTNPYPQPDRWSFLWLAIGCVLMVFVAGNWPLSLAGWLAPLFLIRFMRTQRKLWGYLFMAIGLTVPFTIAYLGGAGPGLPPVIFGAMLGISSALLYLIDRVVVGRLPGQGLASFSATLVFPFLMTGYEFLLLNKFAFGSSGSSAYSQSSNLVLMQMISITGLWGLTFITSWFASTINWIWERKFNWSEVKKGVVIYTSFLLIVLVFGTLRLRFFEPQAGTVRIHSLVAEAQTEENALEILPALLKSDPAAFRSLTKSAYDPTLQAIIREAQAGAQIVILPESAFDGVKEDLDPLISQVKQIAKTENIYVAFGMILMDTDQAGIYFMLIDPQGEIALNHLKYAFSFERTSQAELQVVDTPYGRLSGVLCADLDNPSVISQAGRKGVDILLVPSTDGPENTSWHFRLAAFRSIENGFSLVRPTMEGVSLVTDPFGRTLASQDYFKADEHVMVTQVPIHRTNTVFATGGNWFGWLMVIGFVGMAGWAIFRSHKNRPPES
jgi:apolipoprotein N-acyltransferase